MVVVDMWYGDLASEAEKIDITFYPNLPLLSFQGGSERMTREEIEEMARQERLEYFKKWRANNKDKVRATNQRYWKKRAVAKEQQQLKPYIKVESKGSNTIMEPNKMAFTLEEAAKELGVSKPTLYNLIKREDFPSIRLSKKKIIIPVEPLRKWLNDMAQNGDQK